MVAHNAAGLLSTVLQGMKTKGNKVRSIGQANDAKYAALLPQFIVIKGVGRGHLAGQGAAPNPLRASCASLKRL